MMLLFAGVKYKQFQQNLCENIKVIGLLMGMQLGITKN